MWLTVVYLYTFSSHHFLPITLPSIFIFSWPLSVITYWKAIATLGLIFPLPSLQAKVSDPNPLPQPTSDTYPLLTLSCTTPEATVLLITLSSCRERNYRLLALQPKSTFWYYSCRLTQRCDCTVQWPCFQESCFGGFNWIKDYIYWKVLPIITLMCSLLFVLSRLLQNQEYILGRQCILASIVFMYTQDTHTPVLHYTGPKTERWQC